MGCDLSCVPENSATGPTNVTDDDQTTRWATLAMLYVETELFLLAAGRRPNLFEELEAEFSKFDLAVREIFTPLITHTSRPHR
jgi:hypothetical protein